MKIIDTYSDILNLYNDGVFDKKLWDNYATDAYKSLKETVENDYYGRLSHDYEQEISSVLNNLFRNTDNAEKAHKTAHILTLNLSINFTSVTTCFQQLRLLHHQYGIKIPLILFVTIIYFSTI